MTYVKPYKLDLTEDDDGGDNICENMQKNLTEVLKYIYCYCKLDWWKMNELYKDVKIKIPKKSPNSWRGFVPNLVLDNEYVYNGCNLDNTELHGYYSILVSEIRGCLLRLKDWKEFELRGISSIKLLN